MSVRHHRVVGVLSAATLIMSLTAVGSGLDTAWGFAALFALMTIGYGLRARSLQHRAARRDLASGFGTLSNLGSVVDWAHFDQDLRLGAQEGLALATAPAPAPDELTVAAVLRFSAAYLAALALTPFVVFLRIAGGDLSDLERHDIVGRLVRFQGYWRSQSLRMLTASVAATATVAVVGATGSAAFAAPASAGYTVQQGDTLGSIAEANGTTVAALAAANELADPNLIMVGQVLSLTGSTTTGSTGEQTSSAVSGSAVSGGVSYTVRAGDTLEAIAVAHGTTVAALAAANDLADPNVIMVGQVLALSGSSGSGSVSGGSSATTPSATTPSAATPAAATAATGTYVVRAGDTLGSIAASEGTTWSVLASANDLTNPNLIFIGEVLSLSPTAATATATPAAPAPAVTATAPAPAPAAPAATTPATDTAVIAPTTPAPTTTTAPAPTPAPVVTPTVATSPSTAQTVAVATALAQVGVAYVYGGAGPSGFDCSGLVMYAYAAAGISLPHYTVSQYSDTTRVAESALEPGDLVFYDNSSGAQPGHVALYIGNGEVVAANTFGTRVQTQSITYDGTPMGFGRVG